MSASDVPGRRAGLPGKRFRPVSWWPVLLAALVVGAGLGQPLPPHPSKATGLPALAYTGLNLALWGFLVFLGAAVGRWALRWFRLELPSREALAWALPTGLTLLGYPVYALGLAGLFRREGLAALLLLLTLGWRREMHEVAREAGRWVRELGRRWRKASWRAKLGWSLAAWMLGGSFLLALTPPWMYDALWYHLQAPRLFLEAGRIYPEWNNWPANYAFAVNMLYALPMALGSDVVPRMLHWAYGVVFLLLLYQMARLEAGPWAWLAPVFILTMPNFLSTLAPSALIDVASGTLELMAYGALLRALQEREMRWFWASALWASLAVSAKLAALPALATVGVVWLWKGFPEGLSRRLRTLAGYGLLALALMAPWYLKNWLWFGTPFFPTGLTVLDGEIRLRMMLFVGYVQGSSRLPGATFLHKLRWLLTAPWQLDYIMPPVALPLILFLLLSSGNSWKRNALQIGFLRFLLWMFGPPGIRFLMAAFGLFGLETTIIIAQNWQRPHAFRRWSVRVTFLSTMVLGLGVGIFWGMVFLSLRPWQVVLGWESREAFLERRVDGYRAWQYVREHLGEQDRVLLVGDARHYYCPPQCYPEADHFTWTRWAVMSDFNADKVLEKLQEEGISYLWLHHSSIQWLLEHDPEGFMKQSYAFLQNEILPRCGRVVYQDQEVTFIRLVCLRER